MGAWGSGVFDNDEAAVWVRDLSVNGLTAVEAALGNALLSDYLEAHDGACALAAADVVARLMSGGGEQTSYTEGVGTWVRQNPIRPTPDLVEKAHAACVRVRAADSELRELWADAGEDALEEWLAVVAELEVRLAA